MAFKENDRVEIRITGLLTSACITYYTATVLEKMAENRYYVQYDTRHNRDGTVYMGPVDSDHIRPLYPVHPSREFALSDRVEAYVLEAWRVGTVTGKDGRIYHVKLDGSALDVHCSNSELRPHLEWNNGTWFSPGSGSQSNHASTSAQGGRPANDGDQASTLPQWDQPEDDGSQAKRRRLE